jgi:orotidine-5'-phosphate decarboxylase
VVANGQGFAWQPGESQRKKMKPAKDYIVFPLDVASRREAQAWIKRLCGRIGMFKVGLELFIRSGPDIIRAIRDETDAKIFLDLKLHDIPVTVARAMAGVAEMGVDLATVHCGETQRMLTAAVNAGGATVGVLGVTVLTSVSAKDMEQAGYRPELTRDMATLVMKRADMAHAAGCAGVVCSGLEVARIKVRFGRDFLAMTPGIRPAWGETGSDDQRRMATPAGAVAAGADYLVIGRPIREASDPVSAIERITGEIHAGLDANRNQFPKKIR